MTIGPRYTPSQAPSPARMYDYYLGGKDNRAIDREAAEKALSAVPYGRHIARSNRNFLVRAVKRMAERGIRQFVDLGTGIPTSPNVHETARAINPGARVLYIDNDVNVTCHNRALLADGHGVEAIQADIRHPHAILADEDFTRLIDLTRPVGVLFVAVLHFLTEQDDPHGAVAAFTRLMAAGSQLAVSHITSDGTDPAVIATIREAYQTAAAPAVFRAEDEIRQFFTGLHLLAPGLVDVSEWYAPGNIRPPGQPAVRFLAAIAEKP